MPTTSWIISAATFRLFALVCWFSLCSFSVVPPQKQATAPPVKHQSNKHRLQKKHYRLSQRLKKSKNSQQRLRLQHKIRQVEQQQENQPPTPIFAVLGFGLSLVAFVFLFGAAYLQMTSILILSFLIAVAALIISIVSLTLQNKYPDRYILRGFGIAGIIISSNIIIPLGIILLIIPI